MKNSRRIFPFVATAVFIGSLLLLLTVTSCTSESTTPPEPTPTEMSTAQASVHITPTVATSEESVSPTATPAAHKEPTATQTATMMPAATATPTMPPTPTPLPEVLSAPTNPLSVVVTLDHSRSVSATIPISGTSLSLTAGDGTLFTLTVPDGALLSSQDISLTALSGIEGFPLSGGLAAGVHIEPEGLHLFKAATLTMQLPPDQSTEGIVGFGYHGDGQEFHLVPWKLEGQTVALRLMHLSGYGAGQGTAQDLAEVSMRYPCSVRDRIHNRIGEVLAGQDTVTPEMWQEIDGLLKVWYTGFVKPELEAAKTDDARIQCAIYHFLQWYEETVIVGHVEDGSVEWDAFEKDMTEILKNALNRASDRCISENDPHQIHRMFQWQQLLYLFGDPNEDYGRDVWDRVVACARFELEFDSSVVWDVGHGRVYGAGIPIALDQGVVVRDYPNTTTGAVIYSEEPSAPGELVFRGQGPVELIEFSDICINWTDQVIGELFVLRAEIDLNVGPQESCECATRSGEPAPGEQPSEQDLTMAITLYTPVAHGQNTCGDETRASSSWMGGWSMAHGLPSPSGWEFRDWEIMSRGSPLFAVKQLGGTTFKLWHAPGE